MGSDTEFAQLFGVMKDFKSAFELRQSEMQRQIDAIDTASQAGGRMVGRDTKSLQRALESNQALAHMMSEGKGNVIFTLRGDDAKILLEHKDTITSGAVGASTTGVLQIDRIQGVVVEPRQQLRVRDILTATPTDLQIVDYVRVKTPMSVASPQVEATDFGQNKVEFESKSETIRTIGTWIPASTQIMADFAELASFLNGTLAYYLNLEEELQLLCGSGTGVDLNGMVTQATPFNTGLLGSGWTKLDVIARAMQQIALAKEVSPSFVIMNPTDWSGIRLLKNSLGNYLIGDPQSVARPSVFGLTVVDTTNMPAGHFLVGSGDPQVAEIRERMEIQIELSTSHSDYFVKGLVAIRGERRECLVVKRPLALVYGTFTSSP